MNRLKSWCTISSEWYRTRTEVDNECGPRRPINTLPLTRLVAYGSLLPHFINHCMCPYRCACLIGLVVLTILVASNALTYFVTSAPCRHAVDEEKQPLHDDNAVSVDTFRSLIGLRSPCRHPPARPPAEKLAPSAATSPRRRLIPASIRTGRPTMTTDPTSDPHVIVLTAEIEAHTAVPTVNDFTLTVLNNA